MENLIENVRTSEQLGNTCRENRNRPDELCPGCPMGRNQIPPSVYKGVGCADITKMSENVIHLIIYAPLSLPSEPPR